MKSNLVRIESFDVRDFEQWEGDWELVHGQALAMTPSPKPLHQLTSGKLFSLLDEQLEDCPHCHALIETDVYFSSDTVVRPDVLVVCYPLSERIDKAPALIFEVVSSDRSRRDEIPKLQLYAEEGVFYYGLVYPLQRKIKLYRLVDGAYRKVGDFSEESFTFEGLDCALRVDFSRVWPRKPETTPSKT